MAERACFCVSKVREEGYNGAGEPGSQRLRAELAGLKFSELKRGTGMTPNEAMAAYLESERAIARPLNNAHAQFK